MRRAHLGQERPRVLVEVTREKHVDSLDDPALPPVQETDTVWERGQCQDLRGRNRPLPAPAGAELREVSDQTCACPGFVIAALAEEGTHLRSRGVLDETGQGVDVRALRGEEPVDLLDDIGHRVVKSWGIHMLAYLTARPCSFYPVRLGFTIRKFCDGS
jgi:hypothetical protein